MCGCCVSECNSMESDPDFLGPAALAKGMRFVGDARDASKVERLQEYSERARDLGLHALLLLPRALPEGRRPARRDREARRRGDEGGHRLGHGREAREVVRHLREDDGLAARDRARAEDAGRAQVAEGSEVRDGPRSSTGRCRRRSRRTSRRTSTRRARSTTSSRSRDRDGARGHRPGRARARAARVRAEWRRRPRPVRRGLVPEAVPAGRLRRRRRGGSA